jgi:hypothetical protein
VAERAAFPISVVARLFRLVWNRAYRCFDSDGASRTSTLRAVHLILLPLDLVSILVRGLQGQTRKIPSGSEYRTTTTERAAACGEG